MHFDEIASSDQSLELGAIGEGKGLPTDHNRIRSNAIYWTKSLIAAIVEHEAASCARS